MAMKCVLNRGRQVLVTDGAIFLGGKRCVLPFSFERWARCGDPEITLVPHAPVGVASSPRLLGRHQQTAVDVADLRGRPEFEAMSAPGPRPLPGLVRLAPKYLACSGCRSASVRSPLPRPRFHKSHACDRYIQGTCEHRQKGRHIQFTERRQDSPWR